MKTIFLTLFWLLFFFWLIRSMGVFKRSELSRRSLYFFFIAKLLFGFLLFLIYTHYYPYRNTSDAFKYFDDSQVVYRSLYSEPSAFLKIVTGINADDPGLEKYYGEMETWYREKSYSSLNDNRTIVRINALISIFSDGVYYVHILFFCFFAFAGLVMLHTFISSFSPEHKNWAAALIFLAPSILFWSSGVLKEAVVFFALGGFLLNLSASIRNRKALNSFYLLLFLLLLMILKVYIFLSIIPALVFWIVSPGTQKGFRNSIVFILILAGFTFLFFSSEKGEQTLLTFTEKQKDFINISRGGAYLINCNTHDTIYISPENPLNIQGTDSVHYTLSPPTTYHNWTYWKILDTVSVRYRDTTCYTIYGIFGKTGSSFRLTELQPDMASFVTMLPEAWRNVFFRPFLSEVNSPLVAVSFLENLAYLVLIFLFIISSRKPDRKVIFFIAGSLIFVLILSAVIGFVTPVTGAIVRYRIPMIPFILCSFLFIADPGKLNKLVPFRRYLEGRKQ